MHIRKESQLSLHILGNAMLQEDILCHQVKKPLVPGIGYILLIHWPKMSHGAPQAPQAVAKTGCFLHVDKALLLKTILNVIKHSDVKVMSN